MNRCNRWVLFLLIPLFLFSLDLNGQVLKSDREVAKLSFKLSWEIDTVSSPSNLITQQEEQRGGDFDLWYRLGKRFSIGLGFGYRTKRWYPKRGTSSLIDEFFPVSLDTIDIITRRTSQMKATVWAPIQLKAEYTFFSNYVLDFKFMAGASYYIGRLKQVESVRSIPNETTPTPSYFHDAETRAPFSRFGGLFGLSIEIKALSRMSFVVDVYYQLLDFGQISGRSEFTGVKDGVYEDQPLWWVDKDFGPDFPELDFDGTLFADQPSAWYSNAEPFRFGLNSWVVKFGIKLSFFSKQKSLGD